MSDDKPKNPKQRGLGRGLDALFGDDETATKKPRAAAQPKDPEDLTPGAARKTLGTAQLMPNPDQPRRHFMEGALNELADSIREHWGVENGLHWILDVQMREDACLIHETNGATNFALLRRMALTLIQRDDTVKRGTRAKQKMAGWDNDYLLSVLGINPA